MNAPIGNLELAVIGNCQVAALLDHMGRIVWACLPRPDGDPVFCALLSQQLGDAPDGVFSVDLQDQASCTQSYVRNTAIVETRLYDSTGSGIKITDFAPRFRVRGRVHRPMSIVRIVEPLTGRPIVRLRFQPCAGYGAAHPQRIAGSHHVSFVAPDLRYRDILDVFFGRQANRYRPHAHPLGIAKLHPANPSAKFVEFFFDVPRLHSRDIRRANRGIS